MASPTSTTTSWRARTSGWRSSSTPGAEGDRGLSAPGATLVLLLLTLGCGRTLDYSAVGDVVAVDPTGSHVTIRHEDIPGLMPAMTMRFALRSPRVLAGATPGTRVRFDLARDGESLVVTRIVPLGAAGAGRPGIHDHTPHHGGVVAMVGMLHLEAAATPAGQVRVYLTDVWRRPLPLAGVQGTVRLRLPAGEREIPLVARDDALEGAGPPLDGAEVAAHVRLVRDREPVEMRFVLPLAAAASGAADIPLEGCVPPERAPGPGERLPRCILAFPRPITFVAATPDGTAALVAAVNAGISAWEMPAARFRLGFAPPPPIAAPAEAAPHPEAVNAVAPSPDGRETVVADENRLLVHATDSGRLLRELPPLRGVVRGLAWAPDGGRLLVTLFYDGAAHLLAADDGRELARLPVEREGAAVAFAPEGSLAAVGSELGAIALLELPGATPVRVLREGQRPVEALAFAGGRLVSAGGDGIVRTWDVATGAVLARSDPGGALFRLAVAPGERVAASAGLDRIIRLHDLATGTTIEAIPWHRAAIWGLAWAGPVLVSGDGEGRVALWDLADRLAP